MSHVDEGALHAYLDGALDEYPQADARRIREHLDACAECQERLEDERALREEAHGVLALAAPGVEAPSLEELRAYVRATRPLPVAAVRLQRVGWAASVVLALGVGWTLRGGMLPASAPAPEGAADGGFTDAVVPLREAEAVGSRPVDGPSREMVPTEVAEDPARFAAGAGSVSGDAPTPTAGAAAAQAVFAAGRDADLAEAPEELTTIVVVRSDDIAALPVGSVVAAAALTVVPAEEVVAKIDVDSGAVPAEPVGAPVVSEPALAPTTLGLSRSVAERPLPAPDELQPQRRRVSVEVSGVATPEVTASALRAASLPPGDRAAATSDEAVEEEPPLVIPGMEVVSFANLAEATQPTGLHIIQRLPDGSLLDAYHLPEGSDPSMLPPVEAGRNEVVGEKVGGGWVVLRSTLAREELAGLLEHLVGVPHP